jgi:predicted HicB family RNase H-like nuclease
MDDGRGLPASKPKKYSGNFLLRIPPGLHEALALEAEKSGKSLNAIAADALRSSLQPA